MLRGADTPGGRRPRGPPPGRGRRPLARRPSRHSRADKAVVVRLRDEAYERLVVEVEDPDGAVERINRAVEARTASIA